MPVGWQAQPELTESDCSMARVARVLLFASVVSTAACTAHDRSSPDVVSKSAPPATVARPTPLSTDSAATIAGFEQRVAQLERDTAHFERIDQPLALGAGTSGLLTGWRAGRIWQMLRVDGAGPSFHSRDTYWFADGAFLGARLEMLRTDRRAAVDQIWFRDRALYRWRDPAGRHLDPHARSTQYEVKMMQARLDTLLRVLSASELARQRSR